MSPCRLFIFIARSTEWNCSQSYYDDVLFRSLALNLYTLSKGKNDSYFIRRIKYGNMTHVNVSVAVTDDNKAVMYVALDRSGTFNCSTN